ncbi:hypothetical protein BOTCAL_0211g00070 [Botryotinia calthae]|uniref:Uncharacterized protein n=1 Tax=Botryotinia calthae TaxID=38488 RepID=A0A4Y8D182_9HELO|nr:hypothetical protein BOTCAL_0211g00070 [Botryotinia calthae]
MVGITREWTFREGKFWVAYDGILRHSKKDQRDIRNREISSMFLSTQTADTGVFPIETFEAALTVAIPV